MKVLVIYDNTIRPNDIIKEIVGNRGFGDVVVKKNLLKDLYRTQLEQIFDVYDWIEYNHKYDLDQMLQDLNEQDELEDSRVLYCFSDYVITDVDELLLTYKKIDYIKENIQLLSNGMVVAVMFSSMGAYREFLKSHMKGEETRKILIMEKYAKLEVTGGEWIGEIVGFIQYITGDFSARYFNSLQGDCYELKKSSSNKKKIQREYQYYYLLPENMKHWFVMPYSYQENMDSASYTMERLHMTDVAIKWVHGSIKLEEFSELLDIYFYFFSQRSKKQITKEEYQQIENILYIDKVQERITTLKELQEYRTIENLLLGNQYCRSIDEVYKWYLQLKKKVEVNRESEFLSVIGHGDSCFANTMYNHSTRMLKFIDPKGALEEAELWTNPYYDIAKLSHSVCGNYDFFNNAMFDITINELLNFEVTIPFDNLNFKELFRIKVEENGYDYWLVRLYEASLFLSMLPLHIDYPQKVLGFILNTIEILKEIEENV